MADSSQAAPKGKIFDSRYQIFEIVGRGASSVVYRAKHVLNDDKEIALKVLLPNKGKEHNSDLLRHESLALITARHKNVIRLEDFRSVDSICYLAMEYAPEANLGVYFQRHESKLPLTQAERFFLQIAEALAFLHNIGMLHRDIKPENILVINNRQVRLSDFGVATLPGQTTTSDELQKGVGTLDYMAPEIFKGETSGPGADVYSLALTFYEIFSGQHPFRNLSLAQAMDAREQHRITPLHELNPEIPLYLSNAVSIALETDLEKRFYNGIELLNYLKNKEQGETPPVEEISSIIPIDLLVPEPAPKNVQPEKVKIQIAPAAQVQVSEVVPEPVDSYEITDDWDDYEEDQFETFNESPSEKLAVAVPVNKQVIPEHEFDNFEDYEPEESIDHVDRDTPANFNDFNYQQQGHHEQKTPLWQNLLFYGVAVVIIYFVYQGFFAGSEESPENQIAGNINSALNNPSGVSFSKLPAGIYFGSIQGLTSEGSTALTLIALPNSQIAVLIGVPGWQPVLISAEELEATGASGSLIIKSNGLVLHLQASADDGIISGSYKNNTNNTEGTWSIAPSQS